jgi:hypothetical protein
LLIVSCLQKNKSEFLHKIGNSMKIGSMRNRN